MPTDVLMPALSPTMERGNLIKWTKAVGDKVRSGDIIAEVETDKATMDVEASADGFLVGILVEGGSQDVPVSEVIGLIESEQERAAKDIAKAAAARAAAAPPVLRLVEERATAAPAAANDASPPRTPASPIARRLMATAGLDAKTIGGTGPNGRIIERDVLSNPAYQAHVARSEAVEPAASPKPPKSENAAALDEPATFEAVPHDAMRLTIARRLVEAKQTVPHFYVSSDCEIDALLALRKQVNRVAEAEGRAGPRRAASLNDFIVKALALALIQVPDANVSYSETAMLRHRSADIGVAVAIPGGLLTPIVRNAEAKTVLAISSEIRELAARAKVRRLRPEEYQGGTSSVSNLGMHGVREFSAILNPPQASILAVGAAEPRVVVRQGAPAVATLMTVTLSVDHRAIDGLTAAQLLSAFKALIEEPIALLL